MVGLGGLLGSACDDRRETQGEERPCRCNTDCPEDLVCMEGRREVDGCVALSAPAGICKPKSSMQAPSIRVTTIKARSHDISLPAAPPIPSAESAEEPEAMQQVDEAPQTQ